MTALTAAFRRRQTRDYLDIAALSHRYGEASAARTLSEIDRYYDEPARTGTPVADQVARQLANPRTKDSSTLAQLSNYRRLKRRWRDWETVKSTLREVALHRADEEAD